MPDMSEWSLRDVLKVSKVASLKVNTVGSGFVVKQNIKRGSNFSEGDYLIVELESRSNPVNQEIQNEDVLD
jgi:penicillin-binding protein 2B